MSSVQDNHYLRNLKRGRSLPLLGDHHPEAASVFQREPDEAPAIKRSRLAPASPDHSSRDRRNRGPKRAAMAFHRFGRTTGLRAYGRQAAMLDPAADNSAERLSQAIFGVPAAVGVAQSLGDDATRRAQGAMSETPPTLAGILESVEEEMGDVETASEGGGENETTPPQSSMGDTEDFPALTIREELHALRLEMSALQTRVQDVYDLMLKTWISLPQAAFAPRA